MTEVESIPVLAIPGELTETSLNLREGLTLDEWVNVMLTLKQMSKSIQWWVGDALAYGESRFGEDAFSELDKADKTFANWATTCRKIPPERRRPGVGYSVHAEVAPLPQDQQDVILDEAEWEGYTVGQTRERARELQQKDAEEEHGPSEVVVTRPCPHCEGTGRVVVEGEESETVEAEITEGDAAMNGLTEVSSL